MAPENSKRRASRRHYYLTGSIICLLSLFASCEGFVIPRQTRQQNHLVATRLSMSSLKQDLSFNRTESAELEGTNPIRLDLEEGKALSDPGREQLAQPPSSFSMWEDLSNQFGRMVSGGDGGTRKLPPIQIDDPNLLFYDIFLLLNLVVSISFWVVHRMQLDYIALAFNEGCLLSILWVVAGLYHGAFLYSAVDGNQGPSMETTTTNDAEAEKKAWWDQLLQGQFTGGGPPAAGLLALNTFINTISLRLIVALVVAVAEHRPVFDDPLEQLIPLEVGCGLVLMSAWRTIHSASTPRL